MTSTERVNLFAVYEALSCGPPCAVEMKQLSAVVGRDDDHRAK